MSTKVTHIIVWMRPSNSIKMLHWLIPKRLKITRWLKSVWFWFLFFCSTFIYLFIFCCTSGNSRVGWSQVSQNHHHHQNVFYKWICVIKWMQKCMFKKDIQGKNHYILGNMISEVTFIGKSSSINPYFWGNMPHLLVNCDVNFGAIFWNGRKPLFNFLIN